MDNPFSSEEKGNGSLGFPRSWIEGMGISSTDNGLRSINLDDSSSSAADLMNLDAYAGWCNTPDTWSDQIFPTFAPSTNFSPIDGLNFVDQYNPMMDGDVIGSSFTTGDKAMLPQEDIPRSLAVDRVNWIPRSFVHSLTERMLKALFLLKERSGGGILAQVWVPMKKGNQYVLSTSEQPYLLDQTLSGYREVSKLFTFAAESTPGSFLGLPGRVFTSKIPEWTSNVMYYSKAEYLRVQYAVDHEVRGSIALPVFDGDSLETSCCAVLEVVTLKEMSDFDLEMENICRALQAVNLRSSVPPRLKPQSLSENQRAALAEIAGVLHAVCHAHRLPLALTWIPCIHSEDKEIGLRSGGCKEKCVLCTEVAACYVNDERMHGFVYACTKHYLEEGQGIVGKALQANRPFFYPDVKEYHITEYPLVHHARKCGLTAAVAIRLRSTYTGENDYILELFLPVDMKGSIEQQLLLNNISSTMQRICKSLWTVSDAELLRTEESKAKLKNTMPAATALSRRGFEHSPINEDLSFIGHLLQNISEPTTTGVRADCTTHEQPILGSRKPVEKKRSTSAEKYVSLSVLQQYFSGSLKDAAKSIGVCPTTLKKICRQHGISRWPSRKISKVNRSLKKLQSVLDTVEGVEGGFKFDPTLGGLVAAGSFIQEFDPTKSFSLANKSNSEFVTQNANSQKENEWPSEFCPMSRSSSSAPASDEMTTKSNDDNGIVNRLDDRSQQTSSRTTGSSNALGSRSLTNGCSSSSRSLQNPKTDANYADSGSRITVKATYKEDTIRFKLEPTAGCIQLYEEISKRFNLSIGQFQLKYLDEENEWVMLVSDSDLQECIETLDFLGTRTMKFIVRDVHSAIGSSSGSNNFFG